MWRFLCRAAYGSRKRKIPAQQVSVSMDESKGGFVSWGWHDHLAPQKTWEEFQPLKRKESLWLTVSSSLLRRCYWTLKSSTDDTRLCWFFPTCESPRTSQEKYLLSPVMQAVSFCHASQGWSQTGRFFFFEMHPGLTLAHRLVLSLAICIFKMLVDRDLLFFLICVLSVTASLGSARRDGRTLCLHSARS